MASRSRLLHLPFKDPDGNNDDAHVLLRVSPVSDDPSHPSASSSLDLELLATQGTDAFVATLQQSRVSRYRVDDSSCSEQEWEKYLGSLLVDSHPIGDLDALAECKEEGYLIINVRKRVSGRAQRLGTLRLRRSFKAAENVDVFGWCVEQVIARAQLEKDVEELRRKNAELDKLVAEETAHFQELERGKREFEALHDSFCRDLINEKKLKIRALEQVLSTAHVDQEKLTRAAASPSSKRSSATSVTAGALRKGKRKAENADAHGSDAETHDGMDTMDIDVEAKYESDHDVGMTTPETANESDPEPELKPKSKSSTRKQSTRVSPPSTSASTKPAQASRNRRIRKATPGSEEGDFEAEPRRSLPLNKKAAPAPDPVDDESTASE